MRLDRGRLPSRLVGRRGEELDVRWGSRVPAGMEDTEPTSRDSCSRLQDTRVEYGGGGGFVLGSDCTLLCRQNHATMHMDVSQQCICLRFGVLSGVHLLHIYSCCVYMKARLSSLHSPPPPGCVPLGAGKQSQEVH